MAVAAVLIAGAMGSCSPPPGDMNTTSPDATAEPPRPCTTGLAFTDITSESPDLAAHPYGGEPGWDHSDKYGPGVGLADLNGDGHLDIVQVRSERNDRALRAPVIYAGQGDGTFRAAMSPAWDSSDNATGLVLFDYDGDDDLDLLIGVDGRGVKLYRNDGGFAFADASTEAGLTGIDETHVYTAAAGDVDGDGDLDLYLAQWRADLPEHGPGLAPNALYLNESGVFAKAPADVGCGGRSTLGVALVDIDGDRDLDLYVANDFFDDCLYENDGAGGFSDVSAAAGIEQDAAHAMGVAIGDVDTDGNLDILVTDTEQLDPSLGNALYLQSQGRLRFRSAALDYGLDGLSTLSADWLVCWGVGLEDFDGDGLVDVHIATHVDRHELFLHNRGAAGLEPNWDIMNRLGTNDSRGSAYGDIDGDGDLDIIVGRRNAPLQVLRNDADGRTLIVEPRPVSLAAGATVEIEIAGTPQQRVIQAGSSYMSTSPPSATFGLCDAAVVDRITITVPSRDPVVLHAVPPGRSIVDLTTASR